MPRLPRPGDKQSSINQEGKKYKVSSEDRSGTLEEHRLPSYDSITDKLNGVAPKIRSKSSPMKKATVSYTKEGDQKCTTHGQSNKQTEEISIEKAPAHRGKTTYEVDAPGNGGMELEVLKSIILREDYLGRLAEMSKSSTPYSLVGTMANTLDLVRLSTVEVIEAIASWRKQQPKHMPFKWNGINYLLKVPSDLDFMQECNVMVRWLGFSMLRNPFVMPHNLDARSQCFDPGQAASTLSSAEETFTAIGGIPLTPTVRTPPTGLTSRPSKLKTAYETRIINDEELAPRQRPQETQAVDVQKPKTTFVLPSQIGDLDVLRIREAEKLLLEEEELCGRYKRDLHGRIVPGTGALHHTSNKLLEAVANQQAKTAAIRQMQTATPVPGVAQDIKASPLSIVVDQPSTIAVAPSNGNEKLKGSVKQAGMLAPPSKLNIEGRIRMPMQRSRGAKMEEDLEKAVHANTLLGDHIETLRAAIQRETAQSLSALEHTSTPPGETSTIAMLKKDLALEIDQFERKKREIFRKQEAMEAFKQDQKSAVEKARLAELLRKKQMDEAAILAEKVKLVQIYKATHIQKIIRGILARQQYKTMRIRYKIASTYIEAAVRGFLARRRVYKLYHRRRAAIKIQALARGVIARNATRQERIVQKQNRAVNKIQKIYRGRLGRKRMLNYRELYQAKQRLIYLTEHICMEELADVGRMLCAYSKCPESKYTIKPSHVVLGLVRIIKSAVESCFSPDAKLRLDLPIHEVRWMEAGQYLRRSGTLLRNLHTLSTSAGRMILPLNHEANALIQAYHNDSLFHLDHFNTQGDIAKTCSMLFQWVQAIATICRVQHIFLPSTPVLAIDTRQHKDEDQVESNQCDLEDRHTARQFVPLTLIQDCPRRPRPLLIVLSRDVPGRAKQILVENMMQMFPGLFLRINTEECICIDTIQQAFNAGYSVLFDGDVGLSMTQQRLFLGQFSIVSKALRPVPLNILITGSNRNRAGHNAAVGQYGVAEADLQLMYDRTAKSHLEIAADCALDLTDGRLFKEMIQTSEDDRPPISLVFVMEALLILLTPTQRYAAPETTTSTVTWRLSRRLLATPELLAEKLKEIDIENIPVDNTVILREYIHHSTWPSENFTHGNVMYRIALYVNAVVNFSMEIHQSGGCAAQVTRTKPVIGLFSSVIRVTDQSEFDPNYKRISATLTCSILEDIRVYRKVIKLKERLVLINTLLAPNSMEQHKKPPKDSTELYQRLVNYCVLTKPKGKDPTIQLELRPHARRLCQRTRKIHGHYVTILLSEISLGHLKLDVHVHDTCSPSVSSWTLHIDDDEFQRLKIDSSDTKELDAYEYMDVQTMYHYVLDRIHVEKCHLALPSVHFHLKIPTYLHEKPSDLRVRLRKHGGSGRLLCRQIMKSKATKLIWILTVYEITWTRCLRFEAYQPDTSISKKLELTKRERTEFDISYADTKKHASSSSPASPLWLQAILSRLSISNELHIDRLLSTCVYQMLFYPDMYSATVPLALRSIRVIFRMELAILMKELFGINLLIYLPTTSALHLIPFEDAEIQAAIDMQWPCENRKDRQTAFHALIPHCVYDTDKKLVRFECSCFVKYSELLSPVAITIETKKPTTPLVNTDTTSNMSTPNDTDLLANSVRMLDNETGLCLVYDVAKQLHTGSYRSNGTLLMVTLSITAYLKHINEQNKPGLPDIHKSIDWFDLALEIYNPTMSQACNIHIDGMNELREVTGPDEVHLIGSTTIHEWLHHIMTCRMDHSMSNEGIFTASLLHSRMYSHYKATPINSAMDVNAMQNDHLLIDKVDERGVKITSRARHIRGHGIILTVFDVTPTGGTIEERLPRIQLRVDGYVASKSQRLSTWIHGAALMEAIGQKVHLLQLGEERALADHLIDQLDLEVVEQDEIVRIFIKETLALPSTPQENTRWTQVSTPRCLFKTFCAVSGEKVVVTVNEQTIPNMPLQIQFYQPSSSLSTEIQVPQEILNDIIPQMPTTKPEILASLRHLLSYLQVDRIENECGTALRAQWKLE